MLNQSAQQYIKAQAEFYHSQGCINQKYEVVASPSYMSIYKNKTEEQILYEFLREKRGPYKKHADVVMTPSSNLERERTELINKRQSDHSFSSMDEPSEYPREQKISQSRDIRPPVVNLEKGQSSTISNRDKDDQGNRDNFINSGVSPIERNIEVEDNKPKKGLSLRDKLLQKKKDMETSKAEKPNLESSSVSKNNPALSGNKESRKEEVDEESGEIPLRKKELVNMNDREDDLGERIQGQTMYVKKEEEVSNKTDLSTLTLNSDVGDLANEEYVRRGYMEESKSLMNKVSDIPKQSAYGKKVVKDKEQEEQEQQEGKLKRIFKQEQQQTQGYASQKNVDYETRSGNQKEEEDMYNKSKQAGLRGISLIEDDEEREPLQKKKEPSVVERDYEKDNGRRDMRQSQASNSSRQRGQRDMEEQDFDDGEREPLSTYYKEQMQKSEGYMGVSPSLSQKEAQGYEYRGMRESGHRVRQQDSMPPKSETSIVENNEKKVEKSEKAGARPVVSYLKSIEEMLFKIMAKQDALEENQKRMVQMMNRQQEEIETIRLQMTGEEE